MDAKRLLDLRKQAEKAVADMPDGELKVKAFEVVLSHLLATSDKAVPSTQPAGKQMGASRREAAKKQTESLVGRVLVLRDESFFKSQRALAEVRDELQAHGWHYPLSTLSGTMQSLVQRRELRRQRIAHGKKKVWKYSNP